MIFIAHRREGRTSQAWGEVHRDRDIDRGHRSIRSGRAQPRIAKAPPNLIRYSNRTVIEPEVGQAIGGLGVRSRRRVQVP